MTRTQLAETLHPGADRATGLNRVSMMLKRLKDKGLVTFDATSVTLAEGVTDRWSSRRHHTAGEESRPAAAVLSSPEPSPPPMAAAAPSSSRFDALRAELNAKRAKIDEALAALDHLEEVLA